MAEEYFVEESFFGDDDLPQTVPSSHHITPSGRSASGSYPSMVSDSISVPFRILNPPSTSASLTGGTYNLEVVYNAISGKYPISRVRNNYGYDYHWVILTGVSCSMGFGGQDGITGWATCNIIVSKNGTDLVETYVDQYGTYSAFNYLETCPDELKTEEGDWHFGQLLIGADGYTCKLSFTTYVGEYAYYTGSPVFLLTMWYQYRPESAVCRMPTISITHTFETVYFGGGTSEQPVLTIDKGFQPDTEWVMHGYEVQRRLVSPDGQIGEWQTYASPTSTYYNHWAEIDWYGYPGSESYFAEAYIFQSMRCQINVNAPTDYGAYYQYRARTICDPDSVNYTATRFVTANKEIVYLESEIEAEELAQTGDPLCLSSPWTSTVTCQKLLSVTPPSNIQVTPEEGSAFRLAWTPSHVAYVADNYHTVMDYYVYANFTNSLANSYAKYSGTQAYGYLYNSMDRTDLYNTVSSAVQLTVLQYNVQDRWDKVEYNRHTCYIYRSTDENTVNYWTLLPKYLPKSEVIGKFSAMAVDTRRMSAYFPNAILRKIGVFPDTEMTLTIYTRYAGFTSAVSDSVSFVYREGTDGGIHYCADGNSWTSCAVHYYDGTSWQTCVPHYYDGTQWVTCGA